MNCLAVKILGLQDSGIPSISYIMVLIYKISMVHMASLFGAEDKVICVARREESEFYNLIKKIYAKIMAKGRVFGQLRMLLKANLEQVGYLMELLTYFKEAFNQLKRLGLITDDMIIDYNKASYKGLHSFLNSALIRAGVQSGFNAIPEYKIRLSLHPILTPKGKSQHYLAVDTAFFKESVTKGIGEIYTLDGIHGCLPHEELEEPWVTARQKLTHIVHLRNNPLYKFERSFKELVFAIIVNVFPMGQCTLPSWKDIKRHSIGQWESLWRELVKDLRREAKPKMKIHHIIISESGVEIDEDD